MSDKELSKICVICGDRAHGYNFNAITCESCKAFFRRNALRKKDFKCPFDGNCKIDPVSRKFCKKCRLKKCLDLGMKKEWILSDNEKLTLRNKIAENRKKRQNNVQKGKVDSTTSYKFPNVVQLIQNSYALNTEKTVSTGSVNTDVSEAQNVETNNKFGNYETESLITSLETKVSEESQLNCLDLNQSSSQSSQTSNTGSISDLMHFPNESYTAFCDSIIKSSYNKESNNCFEAQCSAPKPRYFPIEYINSNTTNAPEVQLSNRCSVITDNSIESIRNNCVDRIGDFNTKMDEMDINCKCDTNDDIPDTVYQKAIELEFSPIPFKQLITDSANIEFTKCESERLKELSIAVKDLNHKTRENQNIKITSELTGILDATKVLANRCDDAIRKLVLMSKKMSAFKDLCQHDQIALMKAGCFEILIMRSVVNYNYEHDYWPLLMDQDHAAMFKLDLFKQVKGNLYEAHRKFMHAFKQEWDSDSTILDLLTAIILFTPDRPNIIHSEIIKLEQQIYMFLLQRYLLSKYNSKCEAKMKFLRLMSKLEELHILHDKHVRIYLELDPHDVGPLLIEILDLNPYNTLQIL